MRLEREVKATEVVQPEENEALHIKGIVIAGKEYDLDVLNTRRMEEGDERLILDFNEGDYKILISKEGISFERHNYSGIHGENESLQEKVDEPVPEYGPRKSATLWTKEYHWRKEGWELVYIPFGSRKESD